MTKTTDPIEEGRRLQAEAVAAQEARDKIPPTPTQDEADQAKLGVLDGDFAAPDDSETKTKAETAGKTGSYKTRASEAG